METLKDKNYIIESYSDTVIFQIWQWKVNKIQQKDRNSSNNC